MLQKYIDRFMEAKPAISEALQKGHPKSYESLVKLVIENVSSGEYGDLDASRIEELDFGDYQGTALYIIPEKGYQPNEFWFVKVGYGSCSHCDTLEYIRSLTSWSDETPSEQQIKDYLALALHIIQALKSMGGETV